MEYLIQDTTLSGIADAVREKTGKSDLIPVTSLAEEIRGISSGGSEDLVKQLAERTTTKLTAKDLEGITKIGNYAFAGHQLLYSVEIPDTVTSIGAYAFNACTGTKSIQIPDTVTSIGAYAFNNCKFEEISLPPNITSIPTNMCANCSSLRSIIIPELVTSIGSSAFYYCDKVENDLIIPKLVTSIGTSAFNYCTKILTVIMKPVAPPTISVTTYGRSFPTSITKIIVPKGTLSTYQSATNWSTYANIMEEATE